MKQIIRFLRKHFDKKADKDGYPLVCIDCGHNQFYEDNYDYMGSICLEYNIYCSNCNKIQAVFVTGYFQHVTHESFI